MSIYVIGHKNPDTDAICSAIGYAYVLRYQGKDAEAACCGDLNARTVFALQQAEVPQPRLMMDVRPTAGQICRREVITAGEKDSLLVTFNHMRGKGLRSLPVVDDHGKWIGMVSLLKVVDLLLPPTGGEPARAVHTSLQRIASAIGAEFQNAVDTEKDQELLITVGAMRASAFMDRLHQFDPEKVVLVTGNRPTIQIPAIEYGVRALVVTGGYQLEDELLQQAKARDVSVILSPHDTASTTILIKSAKRVMDALLDQPIHFVESDSLEYVQEKVKPSIQALFPVLDDDGLLLGVFSKSDLLNPPLTHLVLVDHNELSQAVKGVTTAKVLEVIDHHRLGGGLATREPIRFINDPVGSTCTIVARMCRDQNISLPKGIALCLATGIISDTLNLTSPTTTDVDREMLPWLSEQAERDLNQYAESFFSTGSVLKVQTAEEAVRGDCKEYQEGDWKMAVAQIEELGLQRFWERKEELQQALLEMRVKQGFDFACLLVTDIGKHYSILLVNGAEELCTVIDYPRLEDGVFELDGIVSRKKQLLPYLIRLFAQVRRT
ncbi:MAG: putative manganese-dependent inorganic diphosphatase [Verrucomicrobiota bacterium]